MKKLQALFVLLLCTLFSFLPASALTPFWYNGIALDGTGEIRDNVVVNIRITILNGGTSLGSQTFLAVSTDQFGNFSVEVNDPFITPINLNANTNIKAEVQDGTGAWILSSVSNLAMIQMNSTVEPGNINLTEHYMIMGDAFGNGEAVPVGGELTGSNIGSTARLIINNNAITNAKMDNDAIGTPEIQDDAVTNAKILQGADNQFLVTTGLATTWQGFNRDATLVGNGVATPVGINTGNNNIWTGQQIFTINNPQTPLVPILNDDITNKLYVDGLFNDLKDEPYITWMMSPTLTNEVVPVGGLGLNFTAVTATFDVNVDNSTIEINGLDALQIKDDGVTAAKINVDVAGNGIWQDPGGALNVNLLGNSLEIVADAVRINTANSNTWTGQQIFNTANPQTPLAPVLGNDLTNKTYVDAQDATKWGITGNAGLTAGTNFIGTTDNVDLVFKANNLEAGRIWSGSRNVSFGKLGLNPSTTGDENVAIGYNVLTSNTTGSMNIAIGRTVMGGNTDGMQNVAMGYATLSNGGGSGDGNTAVGSYSLGSNTTGSYNVGVGYTALFINGTGDYNVAVGRSALDANVSGSNNVAVGTNANVSAGNLTNATAIGYGAVATASNQVRLGNASVTSLYSMGATTGTGNQPNMYVDAATGQIMRSTTLDRTFGNLTATGNTTLGTDLSNTIYLRGGISNDNIGVDVVIDDNLTISSPFGFRFGVGQQVNGIVTVIDNNDNTAIPTEGAVFNAISTTNGFPFITVGNVAGLTAERAIATNATLTGTDGGADAAYTLGINLGNSNAWTVDQTFNTDVYVLGNLRNTGGNPVRVNGNFYQTAGTNDFNGAINAYNVIHGFNNLQIDGNTTLGSDAADNLTVNALITSSLIPDGTTRDLGTDANRWGDLYLSGASLHIGVSGDEGTIGYNTGTNYIELGGAASVSGDFRPLNGISNPGGAYVLVNDDLLIANSITGVNDIYAAGGIIFQGAGSSITNTGGIITLNDDVDVRGHLTIGSDNTDDITVNGEFITSLIPNAPNTYNLGSGAATWANVYATTFNGALNGNASTATQLQTARDFSVSGDATTAAPVSFNGTANVNLAVTLANKVTMTATAPLSVTNSPTVIAAGPVAISVADAAANGTTKGVAAFVANEFNDGPAGVISLDYLNGQKASGAVDGFLSTADWTTFNNKQPAGNYITALTGDVTAAGPGSAAATVVSVGGVSAANVASGANAANAATSANTPSTIVARDGSGDFAAGTITANLSGNAATATTANAVANALTQGTGITAFSYNGSAAQTVGIAPGGVSATELATDAVTTGKIMNANVTAAKIAGGGPLQVLITSGPIATWAYLTAANMAAGDYTSVINTGTYSINISGNAGTVTNGVYLGTSPAAGDITGSYTAGFQVTDNSHNHDASTITTDIVSSIGGVANDGGNITLTAGGIVTIIANDGTDDINISAVEVDGVIGNEVTNTTDATLTRSGAGTSVSPWTLGLNVGNANTWTATQTLPATAAQGDALIASVNAGTTSINAARLDPSVILATTTPAAGDITGSFSGGFNIGSGTIIPTDLSSGDYSGAITSGTYSINISGNAATATSATTATNLAGGAAGSVPYQTAANTTGFLGIGAANTIMTSTGAAPQWVASLTDAQVDNALTIDGGSVTNSTVTPGTGNVTANIFAGSGSTTNAVDLATAEVSGVLPDANVAADLTISGGNISNSSFVGVYNSATNVTAAATIPDGTMVYQLEIGGGSTGGYTISMPTGTNGQILYVNLVYAGSGNITINGVIYTASAKLTFVYTGSAWQLF